MTEARAQPSGGSVGNTYDNALAESIIGLYKEVEVIDRRGPWRSLDAGESAAFEWDDWFNDRRLRESIGNVFPTAEFESFNPMSQLTMAACLKPEAIRRIRGSSGCGTSPQVGA